MTFICVWTIFIWFFIRVCVVNYELLTGKLKLVISCLLYTSQLDGSQLTGYKFSPRSQLAGFCTIRSQLIVVLTIWLYKLNIILISLSRIKGCLMSINVFKNKNTCYRLLKDDNVFTLDNMVDFERTTVVGKCADKSSSTVLTLSLIHI